MNLVWNKPITSPVDKPLKKPYTDTGYKFMMFFYKLDHSFRFTFRTAKKKQIRSNSFIYQQIDTLHGVHGGYIHTYKILYSSTNIEKDIVDQFNQWNYILSSFRNYAMCVLDDFTERNMFDEIVREMTIIYNELKTPKSVVYTDKPIIYN